MAEELKNKELVDFPWKEVTFALDQDGNFNTFDKVIYAWKHYGFFVIKDLFKKETMCCLEKCSQDPILQDRLQSRTDKDGNKINFLLWRTYDNGLIGACSRCEKVVNTLEAVLGGEIYHYHSKLVLKNGGGGGGINWHQDYGYWYKNGCLTPDMATMWIPLDNVDERNGCLKVIPGSHKLGRIEHTTIHNQTSADEERLHHIVKRFGFVYVRMNVGDGLFFHSNVLHASDSNLSDKRRWAIISSYNLKDNDPVYKHHLPNYYPIEKIPNNDIVHFYNKFATNYDFLADWNDKMIKNEYGKDDRIQ